MSVPVATYDVQLKRALVPLIEGGHLSVIGSSDDTFGLLTRSFPVMGSKIDWELVPGALGASVPTASVYSDECLAFFDRVRLEENLEGPIIYAGDGLTSFAIAGTSQNIRTALLAALEIPQHHYLVGPGGAWCMCFTMEGDMDFGRNPKFAGMH